MARRTTRHISVQEWAAACLQAVAAAAAWAGGSPEYTLLIINPASAESMYLGNYYRVARNIPERNVLYLNSAPASYADFTATGGSLDAFFGQLTNAWIDDHIDVVVLADGGAFYVPAEGYVVDMCSPVRRFSHTAIFTMAYLRSTILAGNVAVTTANHYFSANPAQPLAFSSRTAWLNGSPSISPGARRYFVCGQLGYTGSLGNTVPEILAMIDRAVGVDGTMPPGTFYFMRTTDPLRNVRAVQFQNAANSIIANGGQAQILDGVLPDNRFDCLGIMTGWADPPVATAPIGILPAAFCDHLTSWAATFDIGAQTKISAWIRRGAIGSSGTVEEPCNYTGKFVHANFHALYFQGMAQGEAWLRSMGYVPFQSLLIGDPLARPFARFPSVTCSLPGGTWNGRVTIPITSATPIPGAAIARVEVYIDGVLRHVLGAGEPVTINTAGLPDGWHELRILAQDNTLVRNTGRWIGSFVTGNYGRSVSGTLTPATGNLTTAFTINASASGGTVRELRLLHNGRVIAAADTSPATLRVFGRNIGAGSGRLFLEAIFTDGRTALSAPIPVSIDYSVGSFSNQPPVAFSYTKFAAREQAVPVELPAAFDDALANTTWTVLSGPTQATLGPPAAGYRTIVVPPTACGNDQMTFRVQTPSGQSAVATVRLRYTSGMKCLPDMDGDGTLSVNDFTAYLQFYAAGWLRADINDDCLLNVADFTAFLQVYALGCP